MTTKIQGQLRVAVATWNLQGTLPPNNSVKRLLDHLTENLFPARPDIIAIGTQECQRSLCMSFFCEDKREWEGMLNDATPGFSMITSETLQGLHLGIFIRKEIAHCCTIEKKAVLRAGVCNLLGNKGAVAIKINLLGQNFQFVTCHLAPHQTETNRRNEILFAITENLI